MTNGQNVARSRHLEELARAAKRYTLREILDVTEAVAAELGSLSSPNYDDFTGATSIAGGLSGLVPAPQAGDEEKFLRGDGTWATVSSSSSGYVIGSAVSTVEGGFWQDTINNSPVLKLRHGDYEYNFNYDGLTYLGNEGSPLVTVTPDTYVLGTASSTVDGGVWYELTNSVPQLKLHTGNYNYGFNYDSITYKGNNANLVAYLLFTNNFADACGNEWAATGNPSIVDGALYLNGSSYLMNSTISDSIGELPWTIDFWVSATGESRLFGTFNAKYNRDQRNQWVSAFWENGHVTLHFYDHPEAGQITVTSGTRHHLAFTYDGTTIRLFVDGVLSIAYEHEITLGGEFLIGTSPNTAGFLTGSIDHFRIWKTALWTTDFTPPATADYL